MNKLNFIINRFSDIDLFNSIEGKTIFSLSIKNLKDIENIHLDKLHSEKFYSTKQFNFSLYFNLTSCKQTEEFITELLKNKNLFIQLIFHPNFEQSGNKPLIFITSSGAQDRNENNFITAFESIILEQGFDGIEWVHFAEDATMFSNMIYKFKEGAAFKEFYYQLLTEKYYATNYLGIINDSEESEKKIWDIKLLTEETVKKEAPNQYAFLQKYALLDNEVHVLREKIAIVEEDLVNQKMYLNVMRAEDEANKINAFYYNEYEVLPLWYKKIGHVLKVIIGKRSFRSLFDSNIKKYKN